jgi:hypothetical protein
MLHQMECIYYARGFPVSCRVHHIVVPPKQETPAGISVAVIDLNRHHAPKAVKGNRLTSQDGSSEPPLPINFGARSKQKRPADFQRSA